MKYICIIICGHICFVFLPICIVPYPRFKYIYIIYLRTSSKVFLRICRQPVISPLLYLLDFIMSKPSLSYIPVSVIFKSKIVRVLNLWQKNGVYTPEIIQPLLDMATSSNDHHRKSYKHFLDSFHPQKDHLAPCP